MRPGIIVQHATERATSSSLVRSDITGFIGVVTKDRWPARATRGDFIELTILSWSEFADDDARLFFDGATRKAVRQFFDNGGAECRVFGVMVESEHDLTAADPFDTLFSDLIDRLRGEEDVGLLAMPVLAWMPVDFSTRVPTVPVEPVMRLLLAHCREMNNRFLILDTPRELHGDALTSWVRAFRARARPDAAFGALYYPWLMSGDEEFPPSGSVAGIYARVERAHPPFGVVWPPANEALRGVTHPVVPLRHQEGGDLGELGINPILTQPSRGIVIWGARTLSSEPQWRHINQRRIVSFVSEQIRRDTEWVVFENQTDELWGIVRRLVRARLDQMWSSGLLTGDSEGSEYLVLCDRSNNPPSSRDAGQINVMVRLRPISTAESIVVELRLGADGVAEGGF